MKLLIEEYNIYLEHWRITRQEVLYVPLSVDNDYSFQTLLTLNLKENGFDALGMKHLSDALQDNKVKNSFLSFVLIDHQGSFFHLYRH